MLIKGKLLDAPLVTAASGIALASGSALGAHDWARAVGLGVASIALLWKAVRP